MAVSKIVLPADFGIENLDCAVHGNIEITLKEDQKMRANSMILSLHSPVFQNMFYNLGRTSVELDDFRADVVRQFFSSLYDGKIEINRDNFRDLYKMAVVFQIEWLRLRCEKDFCEIMLELLVEYNMRYTNGGDPLADVLERMEWIFEEALFANKSTKSPELLSLSVDLFHKKIEPKGIMFFVKYYLVDFPGLPEDKIGVAIKISGDNLLVLLHILRDSLLNVSETGLSPNCRFLLNNIDLVKSRQQQPELYEQIFDILLENMDTFTGSDAKMVAELNRQTMKAILASSNKPPVAISVKPNPGNGSREHYEDLIINLFHGPIKEKCNKFVKQFQICKSSTEAQKAYVLYRWIDFISEMKEVRNMYMVFAAVFELGCSILKTFDERAMEKLASLRRRRKFPRINPQYLYDQQEISCLGIPLSARGFNLLLQSGELVSCHESRRTVSLGEVAVQDFFKSESYHTFRFPHHLPETEDCDYSNCLFKFKTTPGAAESPEIFNVQLQNQDSFRYRHYELLSANKIHLMAEMKEVGSLGRTNWVQYVNLSWIENPWASSSENDWNLQLGGFQSNPSPIIGLPRTRFVRLVAYVD